MNYFNKLLASKHMTTVDCLPLWKVTEVMDKEDLHCLIHYIDSNVANGAQVDCFATEACLLYAYWWKNNYTGGSHTWKNAPADLGMKHTDERVVRILEEAVKYELRRGRLGIPILQHNSKQWLDTVLAQGGIPIGCLSNNENETSLKAFLKSLVLYYKDNDFPDWTDASDAISIARDRGMPQFMLNEAFCGACLYYVKAIVEGDGTDTKVTSLRNLLNTVRSETSGRRVSKARFMMDWYIRITDSSQQAQLVYSLKAPDCIPVSDDSDANSRRYYLNDFFVADYLRYDSNYIIQRNSILPRYNEVEDDSSFFLQYTEDNNGHLYSVNIVNGIVPTINEPVFLSYCEGLYWGMGSIGESEKAVFYPTNWTPLFDIIPQVVQFGGQEYAFAKINNIGDLQFQDKEGRPFTLKISQRNYNINVKFPSLEWVEHSSHLLVSRAINLQNYINVLDSDNEIIRKGWSLEFQNKVGYTKYVPSPNIDLGAHTFRVCMPDGRRQYLKLFITGDISYIPRPDKKEIEFDCPGIQIDIMTENVVRNANVFQYPEGINNMTLKFRVNGTMAQVDVALPQCSSFWAKSTGKRVPDNTIVSVSQIHRYKVYQSGGDKLRIKLYELDKQCLRALISIPIQWAADDRYSLSYIGGVLEKIATIYPLKISRKLKLEIGNCCIRVREGSYSLYPDRANHNVILKHNEMECLEGIRLGIVRTDIIFSENIKELIIADDGNGIYTIPEDINEFIVFSTDSSRSFTPQLVDFKEDYVHKEIHIENRANRQEQSIKDWEGYLNNDKTWEKLWELWDITRRYRLNYNTFNIFQAIIRQPNHLALFIAQIRQRYNYGNGELTAVVVELERMESELGFAFHTIPTKCWRMVKQSLSESYEQQRETIENLGITYDEESYIINNCDIYYQLLQRQFGSVYAPIINAYQLFGHTFGLDGFLKEIDYAAKISGLYFPDESVIYIPGNIRLLDSYGVRPFCELDQCGSDITKIRYFAIAIPQYAACYSVNSDNNFWDSTKTSEFIRRMINYIRKYASDVYCDLFCKTLVAQKY